MSTEFEWIKIGAGVLSGGLAGAVLTNIITTYRSRIQPVGKRLDVTPLFSPGFTGSALSPSITVTSGATTYQFSNLHVAEVQVINRGNRDLARFSFGLTLTPGDEVVHIEPTVPDRHHAVSLANPVSPATKTATPDFTLAPFNRGDAYKLRVFIVAVGDAPGAITLSSAEAVRFVDLPSITETLAEIAFSSAVKIGPLEVRFK
ncbi:MAG TPA: hypothetical protein VFI41_07105 [Gemmatimonadales bacterium]|nr:hypothetical protein [Gemmatimonadales bacterium]